MNNKKTSKHNSEPLATGLSQIATRRYVLPSFQRDFVWKMEQIENLFNSIRLGYPFGTLLFWRINMAETVQTLNNETFYGFILNFQEDKNDISQREAPLQLNNDYWVVLDGQQRLTSINIGLLGSYKKRARYQRKDNPDYPEYHLYMLVSDEVENPFKFIKVEDSKRKESFSDPKSGQKWLLVKKIYYAQKTRDLTKSCSLSESEEDRVDEFKEKLNRLNIEFSEITGFDYNEATNIFVRVNSGGTVLEMSDILNSIIITTWKKVNAKEEFKELAESVFKLGFNINTNYIVKSILFLCHSDVRFQIQGFTDFITTIETRWESIKSAILETFALMKSFGLSHSTIGGYNVTLPVLYYIYHKSIKKTVSALSFSNDRASIKQWIFSAILMKIFSSSSSDTTLKAIRSVFVEKANKEDCENNGKIYLYSPSASEFVWLPLKQDVSTFPAKEIKIELADDWYISDESLGKLLTETQKGDRYSVPILSLLYPSYDLNAVNYEQDHLHPWNRYDKMPDAFKNNKENRKLYNSIVNLQLLQKEPNIQKSDITLKKWVERQTIGCGDPERKAFLNNHLIPDVSLEESDITTFLKKRKEILVEKLKKALE